MKQEHDVVVATDPAQDDCQLDLSGIVIELPPLPFIVEGRDVESLLRSRLGQPITEALIEQIVNEVDALRSGNDA